MGKWHTRSIIANKFNGLILPHIKKRLKEESFNLEMDVAACSPHVAEVCVKGSNGFKCVVNLQDRTCSCRKFEVSGIPCKHATTFITSMKEPLEKYVDTYYSVDTFRAAYENLILAMTDKSQWKKFDHGFFMYLPLLVPTAGRRKNVRFKGGAESNGSTTRKKGQHRCDICQGYGYHWHTCKNGNPDDIAAMKAERYCVHYPLCNL